MPQSRSPESWHQRASGWRGGTRSGATTSDANTSGAPSAGVEPGAPWHGEPAGGWPSGPWMSPALRLWIPVVLSFLVQVPAAIFFAARFPDRPGGLLAVALALVGPVALIGARRFPGPVVLVTALAAAALLLSRPDIGTPYLALGFAIALGIVRGARIWVYASIAAVWVATIVLAGVFGIEFAPVRVAVLTLALAFATGIGEMVRARRERFREFRRIADDKRMSAEQRERVRIARELHDVLAHSLSQINVQAGVGLHLIDSQPDKAAEALANIKDSSKNALDEVRSVLGILRSDGAEGVARADGTAGGDGAAGAGGAGAGGADTGGAGTGGAGAETAAGAEGIASGVGGTNATDFGTGVGVATGGVGGVVDVAGGRDRQPAPLAPEPDFAALPALIHSFRAQGMTVTYVSALEAESAASAATQLAMYRICQEALTNVLRHSNGSGASVYLGFDRGEYLLTVTDDGTADTAGKPIVDGGGLLGMRERAELLGGSLQVGFGDRDGFHITARLPQRPEPWARSRAAQ